MKQLFCCYFKKTTICTISILMLLFATSKINAQAPHQKIDDMIKINPEKYDFGEVKQSCEPSDAIDTYVEITNISDKPVVIHVQGSWAYLLPMLEATDPTIAPHKTYKLKVRFSPCRNIGIFDKGVYITIDGIEEQINTNNGTKNVIQSEHKGIRFTGKFAK